jgi:hypothetical protein
MDSVQVCEEVSYGVQMRLGRKMICQERSNFQARCGKWLVILNRR